MEHKTITELIHRKLDREITPDEQRMLDAHLAACAICARRFEEMAGLDRSLRHLTEFYPGRDFNRQVLSRLGIARKYAWTRAAAIFAGAWIAALLGFAYSPLPAELLGRMATSVPALVRFWDKVSTVAATLGEVLAPFARFSFNPVYPVVGTVLSLLLVYFLGNALQKERKCIS